MQTRRRRHALLPSITVNGPLVRVAVAVALALTACGEKPLERAPAPTTPTSETPESACTSDRECTGDWTPRVEGCGPVDRCYGGQCIEPPAISGIANSQTGTLFFDGAEGQVSFKVELVSAPFETSRGLMCRREMRDDWGMLFFMRSDKVQRFWMKNTLIPLDMLFLDRNWQVVGIVEGAEPRTLEGRGVNGVSRYVLELTAGQARRAGLEAGQTARYEGPR